MSCDDYINEYREYDDGFVCGSNRGIPSDREKTEKFVKGWVDGRIRSIKDDRSRLGTYLEEYLNDEVIGSRDSIDRYNFFFDMLTGQTFDEFKPRTKMKGEEWDTLIGLLGKAQEDPTLGRSQKESLGKALMNVRGKR